MATSTHLGRLDIDAAVDADSDQFCDEVYLRDGLINGLNHLGDEWAQVRINFVAPDPDYSSGTVTDGPLVASEDVPGQWLKMAEWPFPISVMEAGPTPYRFRLYVGGAGFGSSASEIRVAIAPHGTPIGATAIEEASDAVWAGVPGASPSYISGATRGAGAYADSLILPGTVDGPLAASLAVFGRPGEGGAVEIWSLHLSEVVPV